MAQKTTVIANWKMNPETLALAIILLKNITKHLPRKKTVNIIFAVPAIFLHPLKEKFRTLSFAVQDVSAYDGGAHTGEISAVQAYACGARHAIIGHSEKRASGDTNEIVYEKIKMALSAGLSPIICVGETVRDQSHSYLKTIEAQVVSAFKNISRTKLDKIVIAYEPVWAIGKNATRTATPEESLEMSIFIRRVLSDLYGKRDAEKVQIVYGGSVDEKNGVDFVRSGGVTGLLPGRLSLSYKKFTALIQSL